MTKAISQTYNVAMEYREYLVLSLCAACIAMIFAYGLSVYRLVSHTVAMEKIQSQTSALSKSVNSLDARYLDLSSSITPDRLKAYGMTQGQVSEYIPRTASLGSVAERGHEL